MLRVGIRRIVHLALKRTRVVTDVENEYKSNMKIMREHQVI
jgi:hypothetical protein